MRRLSLKGEATAAETSDKQASVGGTVVVKVPCSASRPDYQLVIEDSLNTCEFKTYVE